MNNKKNNEGQSDFSYYGLYLMDYLRTNKFEQATDTAFIRERADRAAETYEKARIEGYPTDGAQELAMEHCCAGCTIPGTPCSTKSWRTSLPTKCRKRNKKPLSINSCRLSATCSPSMTFRTTTSPCLPITTCSIRS